MKMILIAACGEKHYFWCSWLQAREKSTKDQLYNTKWSLYKNCQSWSHVGKGFSDISAGRLNTRPPRAMSIEIARLENSGPMSQPEA